MSRLSAVVEVQAPLPHDIQYILDEALEQDDLNGFDHLVLTLFADRQQLEYIISAPRPSGWKNGTAPMCLVLDELAHNTADNLPIEEQTALIAASLLREKPRLESLAWCHADWNYTDSTEGGALKPFKRRARVDSRDRPIGQIKRRLRDQRSINRFVAGVDCESTFHAEKLALPLRQRRVWPDHPSQADQLEQYFAEQHRRYNAARERATAQYMSQSHKQPVRQRKREQQSLRKAVIRSAEAASAVIGRGNVMTLARGEPVFITGQEVTFRLAIRQLHQLGHGALDIHLCDKTGINRLADVCLYFDDTPALEQVAAIAMHIEAGEELELVKTGNLSNISPAGAMHPVVGERLKQRRAAAEDLANMIAQNSQLHRQAHSDMRRILRSEYADKSTPLYLEPLIDRVWVNKADQLRAFFHKSRPQPSA